MTFDVIDTKTGRYPDVEKIALTEEWAKGLIYCDIDCFAVNEDGSLILIDDCGNIAYPPEGRFEIVPEKEANEPLTLEQLREMDGEPVWGKSLITGKPGEWFILRVVEMSKTWFIACAGTEQGFGDKDTYGETWVAYHCPQEGEKDA